MFSTNWFLTLFDWLGAHAYAMQLLVLVIIAVLLQVSASLAYRYFFKKFTGSRYILIDAILHSLRKPITLIIWYLVFIYALQLTLELIHYKPLQVTLDQFANFGIIISLMWFLLHFIGQIQTRINKDIASQRRYDETSVHAVARIARIIVVMIAFLCLLPIFGLPLATIYTIAGGLSIGISLAAQDLLKNIFGGFMLYFERPFGIGDWIASPDKSIEGRVETIGWRTTCIRAFNTRPMYVANAVFSTVTIINYSRMQCWRMEQVIHIRYQDFEQVNNITHAINQLLQQDPNKQPGKISTVNLINLDNSSLTLKINAYINTKDENRFKDVQQELLIKIIAIITEQGGELAGQTQTIVIPEPITIIN
ncbi:MAG: mechanosensitive ion channel family protein [Gammaproteobacteria bacterium]|nr:mechanosensitive ion channel family protein [Gammaproteobacteria bacterium]